MARSGDSFLRLPIVEKESQHKTRMRQSDCLNDARATQAKSHVDLEIHFCPSPVLLRFILISNDVCSSTWDKGRGRRRPTGQ